MKNSKVINFELLYIDKESSTEELIYQKNLEYIIEELRNAKAENYSAVTGLLLLDGLLYKDNKHFVNMLKEIDKKCKELKIVEVTLLSGMCENSKHILDKAGVNFKLEFFDFTSWMIYQSYQNKLKHIKGWNSNSKDFLFLGGIPSRWNRIKLLSQFYKNNMLNCAVWSFFPPWEVNDIRWCRNALSYFSDDEYYKFLMYADKVVDNGYSDAKNYSKVNGSQIKSSNIYQTEWIKDPGYINTEIYNNTLFSVISEGNAYDPATDFSFLTEKTWRAVANKHPFIIAGYPEQIIYAKQRGLRTFEDYFLIKDYYLIEDEDERISAIVKNTKYFLENYKKCKFKIQLDIEHNFNVFIKTNKNNKKIVDNFTKNEADIFFNQKGFSHLIRVADGN
jgi:hypothetical protein